ncbi:AraC family transcriptional regulator [Clostridium estertheticum]|uniref:AraC family transcriptional regulator n=1 Tax=Clostridium estertheticum TaxID=238834 RepID=UPI001CD1246D|nr:AraC family transcriptional regulator [Clostridium estertheticum]MBZ9686745.1 AraC family transcriptional regulator [Clostridium estertheticum]
MDAIFFKTTIETVILIERIITIHYFEFASDYVFKGEKHDFWELLYVDKGEVEIMADTKGYKLEQGDIVFHKPNEFHSVWANGTVAPNIVVVSFECMSQSMKFFENKILKLSYMKKNRLAELVKEAKAAYTNNLGRIYTKLIKRESSTINENFGAEQLIKNYLEIFLIELVREDVSIMNRERLSFATKERMEDDIVHNIIEYLKENVDKNFGFNDICDTFAMGRTHLKTAFKKGTNQGVMAYFKNLKIEESKKMIREGKNNFTEISQKLGYDSLHYFSRSFKKSTNMTPSEYAVSVKAIAQI